MGLIVDMPTHTGALNGVKVPVAIPTSPHDEGDAVDLGRLCEKNTEAITANIADGATIPVGTVFPIGFTLTDYLKKK